MAKSQRTKVQIMVDITIQRGPKINQHKHHYRNVEDPKVVSKTRKLEKGKQYIIQTKRDNDPLPYTEDHRLSNANPTTNQGELWKLILSCFSSGTRRVSLDINPVMSQEIRNEGKIVTKTNKVRGHVWHI